MVMKILCKLFAKDVKKNLKTFCMMIMNFLIPKMRKYFLHQNLNGKKENKEVWGLENEKIILIRRWHHKSQVLIILNCNDKDSEIYLGIPKGKSKKILDSSQIEWMG